MKYKLRKLLASPGNGNRISRAYFQSREIIEFCELGSIRILGFLHKLLLFLILNSLFSYCPCSSSNLYSMFFYCEANFKLIWVSLSLCLNLYLSLFFDYFYIIYIMENFIFINI